MSVKKKKFSSKDQKLRDFLVKGGREGSKKDFLTLLEGFLIFKKTNLQLLTPFTSVIFSM